MKLFKVNCPNCGLVLKSNYKTYCTFILFGVVAWTTIFLTETHFGSGIRGLLRLCLFPVAYLMMYLDYKYNDYHSSR